MNRRGFVATMGAVTLAAGVPVPLQPQARTRLILLGTAGGPTPKRTRSGPAQVILAGDAAYVVDCGDGVARQAVLAGVPFNALRHIFITHHHSDHNADYGNLLLLFWASGLAHRVDSWGPAPLTRITELFLEMSKPDIDVRVVDEGRPPLGQLIHPHEIQPGLVMEDDNLRVTAALVHHPMVPVAYAYRFDAPDRSIVISGDTARSDAVVKLARGADVLVHEAFYPQAVEEMVTGRANAEPLRKHLLASHTSAEDCGRVAAAAGVRTLVLSHFVPAEDPPISDAMWAEAAGKHFKGKIIVGRDLMEV
ncbi:MAG TPA: MBL fold metallo-hydrolase [Gemmatimonadales bacterium]|nr:MBL fold metallo-hydrolase [Gemmatimonadales bacterium]